MKITIGFFCLLLLNVTALGQVRTSKYEAGLLGGIMLYQGDLTPHAAGDPGNMKPAFNIYGSRKLNNMFAVRLNLTVGKLQGDDADYEFPTWRRQRNLNFRSPVTEISGMLTWNILGLQPSEAGIINFTPYLLGGVGYSFLKVRRDWSNFNNAHFAGEPNVTNGLAEDIAHRPPRGILVFPIGAGARYGINSRLSLAAEALYRVTATDYLDGFSKAANPKYKDHYTTYMVGVIYSFGKNVFDCPGDVQ